MDPFLENHWGDVHTRLTTYAADQLQPRLPAGLAARIEEFVHLDVEDSEVRRHFRPDVRVIEDPWAGNPVSASLEGVVVARPWVVPLHVEWTERWIQIMESGGSHLVTTIEFLSPGNKSSERDREQFQEKQRRFLEGGVNVVEIDLVREGGWTMTASRALVPENCTYPYRIVVVRADHPSRAECYEVSLRERLPAIRIPLRPGDPDAVLELQLLIDAVWINGGYGAGLYEQDCPRFRPDDDAWIQERIAAWKTPPA